MTRRPIEIADKTMCCGCRACANVCPQDAISFVADEYGFYYPQIDESKCTKCGLCKDACTFGDAQKVQQVVPLKACAAVNTDVEKLKHSSSGGVFRALAEYVLNIGGAVCGCILDQAMHTVHICAETIDGVMQICGSKYVQSNVGFIYREARARLKTGQFVLFTGTPCQVAGLYATLGWKRPDNLLTVDLVCHGVPSERIFHQYLKYLEKKYNTKIADFRFRSKKYGWQRWTTEYIDEKGRVKNLGKLSEFYIPAFTTGNIMRPGCFTCKYACKERVGDITIGDLWGQEKHNLSLNTQNGVSLCTFNNEKALEIMKSVSDRVILREIDYETAVQGNRCLNAPTEKGNKWERYMEAVKADRISDMAQAYIKTHKKVILRYKLKYCVPLSVFSFIRKKKYGRS